MEISLTLHDYDYGLFFFFLIRTRELRGRIIRSKIVCTARKVCVKLNRASQKCVIWCSKVLVHGTFKSYVSGRVPKVCIKNHDCRSRINQSLFHLGCQKYHHFCRSFFFFDCFYPDKTDYSKELTEPWLLIRLLALLLHLLVLIEIKTKLLLIYSWQLSISMKKRRKRLLLDDHLRPKKKKKKHWFLPKMTLLLSSRRRSKGS